MIAIQGGQHTRGYLLRASVRRHYGRPTLALQTNLEPTLKGRTDRAVIGVWYLVLTLGPWLVDITGRSRRQLRFGGRRGR